MTSNFDPLQHLLSQEAIRFVGTVGDVSRHAPDYYNFLLSPFQSREVRSLAELRSCVLDYSKAIQNRGPITKIVAEHTVEVAAAIGLIVSVAGAAAGQKKYVSGDHGRVINAMRNHKGWADQRLRSQLHLRPMFEGNGDYLLQALVALDTSHSASQCEEVFRSLVAQMARAKFDEIPARKTGSRWDAYRAATKQKMLSILGVGDKTAGSGSSIEMLQKKRRASFEAARAALTKKPSLVKVGATDQILQEDPGTKTLGHHFARCRGWLEDLFLVERKGSNYSLTDQGKLLLAYFKEKLTASGPLRLPPTASTLFDCFRLSDEEIFETWGAVVSDSFWEEAQLAIDPKGVYLPTDAEVLNAFRAAHEAVRVERISEAMMSALRAVAFYSWLWDGKPVRSTTLAEMLVGEQSIPRRFPNEFTYGKNRQGRLAYVFRRTAR